VYFTTAWKPMVSFPVLSVVVCAWSTTPKLCGRPASVGLAQAHPNKLYDASQFFPSTQWPCRPTKLFLTDTQLYT